jgi:hypothetical protein
VSGINNLTVGGDLFIDGTAFVVHSGEVSTSDNIIYINAGEVGPGVTAGQAGIEVDRGSATNYQFLFVEASDDFRVGEVGDLQAVATREDNPTDLRIPWWNDSEKRFDTLGDTYVTISDAGDTITSVINTSTELTLDADGLSLNAGASVNEILDSGDDISAASTDDQLATASLIYDELQEIATQLVDIKPISSDSTATAGDVALVDTAGGDVTIDLQEAVNSTITIKKMTADGNDVIVTANGTLDGAAQIVLDTQYQSVTLVCDGTDWYVI